MFYKIYLLNLQYNFSFKLHQIISVKMLIAKYKTESS